MPSPELDLTNVTATTPGEAMSATAQWSLSGRIDESQPNRQFGIHSTPFTIGRRPESSLSIQTGCISKNHAEIHVLENGRLLLRDLNSTNGTYVNGEAIDGDVEITDGDLVQFATIVFRVGRENKKMECNTIQENVGDHALAMMQFDRLINDGGLYPHFQPIVRLQDQETIGYEVLGAAGCSDSNRLSKCFWPHRGWISKLS